MFPEWSGRAKPFSRTERPPKYYLNNFDRSIYFSSDDLSPFALPVSKGRDHDRPPRIVDANAEHDPFPIDMLYYMGILWNIIIQRYA